VAEEAPAVMIGQQAVRATEETSVVHAVMEAEEAP